MIYDKARMAKLSGLMTESSHKGIKDPKAKDFGGATGDEGDAWLDGEVSTADHDLHEGDEDEAVMPEGDEDEGMHSMEAKKHDDDDMDEVNAVREMIRTEMRNAKKQMDAEEREEEAVREAVRREIRSVLRTRGVTLGGTGIGFKR